MEISQIAIWVLGVACTILGWFARELYGATQSLRRDLSALEVRIGKDVSSLEVRIGTDYIRYDRMQDALKPVMESLTEIKHALDRKADKP